jgi:hypothetical protein
MEWWINAERGLRRRSRICGIGRNNSMSAEPIARYSSRAGLSLPIFAILFFLADKRLLEFFNLMGSNGEVTSNFSVLRNQYEFLERQGLGNEYTAFDFQLFQLFICVALVLCVSRSVFAILSSVVLDSFKPIADRLRAKNLSTRGFIIFFVGVGLLLIIFATNFSVTAHSDPMRFLMMHAPRAFVCLCVMLFCWGAFFFTEGLLFIAFLIREQIKSRDRNRA